MFANLRLKLNNQIIWGKRAIYLVSLGLCIFMLLLIILRVYNSDGFWLYVKYSTLLFVLLDFLIINQLASKEGIGAEKLILGVVLGLSCLNLLWLVETTMSVTANFEESIFLPLRLNNLALLLGLILLSLNKGPLGFWLKSWLVKFRDPRAFIVLALVFLILCPFLLVFQQESVAEKAANMAYFMLVIGVMGQFIEYVKGRPKGIDQNHSV